ncbi:MAG: thiamine phosphate synthase [Pseudomonadota bacterium]
MTDGPGLYLISPPLVDVADFLPRLNAALDAVEVACIRLDMATTDEAAIKRAADQARETAHAHDVAITLTNHYRIAKAIGLDGVHLANPRLTVREAREHLGKDAIVGAYAGASRHDGMVAAEAGADYVSFGPVAANELGDGEIADLSLFEWWAQMIETPVVAEGGLTAERAAPLAAHVDFVAPDPGVWSSAADLKPFAELG